MLRFLAPLSLAPFLRACDPLACENVSDDTSLPEMDLAAPPRPSPVIEAGEVMGPCKHDPANVYHSCEQGNDPDAPRLCAVPQEPGIEHASVCVERRAEGTCPEWIAIDGEPFDLTQDDGANACVIACSDSSDCPASTLCSAGMCAYPTF